MSDKLSRYVQVDDWIFEVKALRAIRVNEYGKPYSAIANLNINGNNVYIDGLLTRDDKEFTKEDYMAFKKVCQSLEIKKVTFDRYKHEKANNVEVQVEPVAEKKQPQLYLVKG